MRLLGALELSIAGAFLLESYALASVPLPRGQPGQPVPLAVRQDASATESAPAKPSATSDGRPRTCTAERLQNGGFDGEKPDPFVITYAPELHFAAIATKDQPHVTQGGAGQYLYAMFSNPAAKAEGGIGMATQKSVRIVQPLSGVVANDTFECSGSFQAAVQSWRSNMKYSAIAAEFQVVASVGGVPCANGSFGGAGIAVSTDGAWQEVKSLGRQNATKDNPDFVLEFTTSQWGAADPSWVFVGLDNLSVIGSSVCEQ